jgi:glycine/D-amino acid oxidase-like deaminating enzyme
VIEHSADQLTPESLALPSLVDLRMRDDHVLACRPILGPADQLAVVAQLEGALAWVVLDDPADVVTLAVPGLYERITVILGERWGPHGLEMVTRTHERRGPMSPRCTRAYGNEFNTPDGLPVIGRPPEIENLTLAAGHGMWGLQRVPGTALLVAQLIAGRSPSHDLGPLCTERFGLANRPRRRQTTTVMAGHA